jgi:hypothetical protein
MNHTLTSVEKWKFSLYNEHVYSLSFSHLDAPTLLDRGDFSGDLTDFTSNRALECSQKD